ncbi:MAG: response regulator transcription factor [Anaerolineales bacterium]|nr:MAG: response regulator transcription factor [Anaerolineales bacterium]
MDNQAEAARLMVVDDEAVARVSLAEVLKLEGYEVLTAASGEEALGLLEKSGPFDLMVVDLKMPGMDGLAVTEVVRECSPGTVVILLTAFATVETAIDAVRQGAHDYLLKPCLVPEVLESVRKGLQKRYQEQQRHELVGQLEQTISRLASVEGGEVARQPAPPGADRFARIDDLSIDRQKHVAAMGGRRLDLTPTEFKILACLMETPDKVWSPQELVRRAQGYETDAWGARAIVRVHIRRLRKKIEDDPSSPRYILNVRGVGYVVPSSPSDSA